MSTPEDLARRAQLVSGLTSNLPTLTDRVVTAVTSEVPAYRNLAPGQLDEVQQIAAWGLVRVLEAWTAGEGLTTSDLRRFEGIGAARALDGRPLTALLRAYHVAARVITDLVVEASGPSLTATDAVSLARLWMATIDQLTSAVVNGHTQAREHVESDPGRGLTLLLDDLLAGRHSTASAVQARAAHLGVRLPSAAGLLLVPSGLVDPSVLVDTLERAATARDDGAPTHSSSAHSSSPPRSDLTATTLHEGWWVVLDRRLADPDVTRQVLRSCLGARAAHACWAPTAPDEVANTFHLLARAAPLAPEHLWEQRPYLGPEDASCLLLTSGEHTPPPLSALTTGILHRLLAPLEEHPALRATLDAFLATGSAEQAARRLGCHPQTLRHRIARIAALTGRDLRRTWDRHVLEVAHARWRAGTDPR